MERETRVMTISLEHWKEVDRIKDNMTGLSPQHQVNFDFLISLIDQQRPKRQKFIQGYRPCGQCGGSGLAFKEGLCGKCKGLGKEPWQQRVR